MVMSDLLVLRSDVICFPYAKVKVESVFLSSFKESFFQPHLLQAVT